MWGVTRYRGKGNPAPPDELPGLESIDSRLSTPNLFDEPDGHRIVESYDGSLRNRLAIRAHPISAKAAAKASASDLRMGRSSIVLIGEFPLLEKQGSHAAPVRAPQATDHPLDWLGNVNASGWMVHESERNP